jgi:hypothetical protein
MKNSVFWKLVLLCVMLCLGGIRAGAAAPDFFALFNSKEPVPAQVPALPPEVGVLLDMERILNRIRAGEKPEFWRPLLRKYADFKGDKGVGAGLRELALAWEARGRISAWDGVLRGAYRKKARFPETLEGLLPGVAEDLRTDPWGEAWTYALSAPAHSPQLVGQRYVLAPARLPKLSALSEAVKTVPQPPQAALRFSSVANVASLEVNSKVLQPSRAFKLVGDRFGSYWVMWLASSGVILCNEEGFLALGF